MDVEHLRQGQNYGFAVMFCALLSASATATAALIVRYWKLPDDPTVRILVSSSASVAPAPKAPPHTSNPTLSRKWPSELLQPPILAPPVRMKPSETPLMVTLPNLAPCYDRLDFNQDSPRHV